MQSATLQELAAKFGCRLRGRGDAIVTHVATLSSATGDAVTFLANPLYRDQLLGTRAGAVVLQESFATACPVACLITENPYATYARIAAYLHPRRTAEPGIHPTASVAPSASVPKSAHVGAGAVIGASSTLGANVVVGAGAIVGRGVRIGKDTQIAPRVSLLDDVSLGERCIVHSGAVVGADGFGFAEDRGEWVKIPHLGTVVIGNDVEIGANTTIDRGTIEATVLEDGVKLDNLVQIAHNVRIGAHTVMAAMSGAAGSTRIGQRCKFGGGAVVANQLTVCDDVTLRGGDALAADYGAYAQPRYNGRAAAGARETGARQAAQAAKRRQETKIKSRLMTEPTGRDIEAILERLPHRFPFLMVDRVVSVTPGRTIVALKNVTANEAHFVGHFPGHPVMPGVLVVEALAQAGGILVWESIERVERSESILYLLGIENARFKHPVTPGDQIVLKAELIKQKRNVWFFHCVAEVDSTVVVEADVIMASGKKP
jgi:UDP-3-O-[3-hydroxymyristoyl] glucosamine N-acyltransferase